MELISIHSEIDRVYIYLDDVWLVAALQMGFLLMVLSRNRQCKAPLYLWRHGYVHFY